LNYTLTLTFFLRPKSLSEESANLLVHVAQEVDVGEVELAGAGPRSAPVLAEEMSEENVQLVALPDQHQLHVGALPLLADEVDDGADLAGRRVVALLQRRFVDVDLRRCLNAENVVDPGRTDSQSDEEEHVDAVLQYVDSVVGHFLDGAPQRVRNDDLVLVLRAEVVKRKQTRVEVGDGRCDVHRPDAVHQERAIVAADVGGARERV